MRYLPLFFRGLMFFVKLKCLLWMGTFQCFDKIDDFGQKCCHMTLSERNN